MSITNTIFTDLFSNLLSNSLTSSFLLVVASEMGDKTQLLALVLAAKFRRPWTVMAGILLATLLNHGLAAWAGGWVARYIDPQIMAWILSATFFVFALWILSPDQEEDLKDEARYGAFITTAILFFLAEMGDKTQLATVALGARFENVLMVTIGTTAGMLVADGLAVFFGERLLRRVSMKWVRVATAVIFALFGAATLISSFALKN